MKVLLIRPPRRNAWDLSLNMPPLGLAYVAASARNAGHQVEILDCYVLRWSWKRFSKELKDIKVDVIGFSAMTPVWDVVERAILIARDSADKIVIGGPHPTASKDKIFQDTDLIDATVVGEGEDSFPALLDWWEQGEQGDSPKGILLPNMKGLFQEADLPAVTEIAWPARILLKNDRYRYLLATKKRIGTMITSRGCPFRCSFCDKSVSGSSWRARTAVDVVDEMQEMVERFGIEFINIYDDNFLLNRKRVIAVSQEIIRRKLKISWKCEGRVDGIDREVLAFLEQAGCEMIAFGVESGNEASLNLLRKDISIAQTRHAFELMKESKIKSLAYMILGVPGETVEDVRNSIRFCEEIGVDYVQFSSLTAMPGTEISGMYPKSISVPNPLDVDMNRETISSLSQEDLQMLMREAWLGFYGRPRKIKQLGMNAIQSGYVSEGVRSVGSFLLWYCEERYHQVSSKSFFRASEA